MKNSFSRDKQANVIFPGIILYEDVISLSDEDIYDLVSLYININDNPEKYDIKNIKNTFFHGLNKIGKKEFAENVQKSIMYYFAKYCEIYPETIHNVQWQENIYIDVEFAGDQKYIFNPNKSFEDDNNNIKNTPFSRQVVIEISIDDDYVGGSLEWIYLNNIKIEKMKKGSILVYPANYLFSKKHDTIIKGRKVLLTTFLNGGKDFLAEENGLDENSNLAFSYLR
jgi:hypothetical protein